MRRIYGVQRTVNSWGLSGWVVIKERRISGFWYQSIRCSRFYWTHRGAHKEMARQVRKQR